MKEYSILTKGLTKRYGSAAAVDRLNLAVPKGCVYGFIGPNGAGKSTTMKLLLGLVRPTSGSITLLGQPMNAQNRLTLLRRTGSLIESPSGYGHLSAQENCEIVAGLKGVPKKDVARVLDIVHLTGDRHRRVSQYSLGMKQRLGIAMALLGKPELLILDEPTNGLDPAGIQEMRELIAHLPRTLGATVLISSHLLSELEQMVTQVGVVDRGRLLYQGTLTDLQSQSRGSVSIRVLDGAAAARALGPAGLRAEQAPAPAGGCLLTLPPLEPPRLAAAVRLLAQGGAGVVEVAQHTKTLEEIFLTLTEAAEAAESGV